MNCFVGVEGRVKDIIEKIVNKLFLYFYCKWFILEKDWILYKNNNIENL